MKNFLRKTVILIIFINFINYSLTAQIKVDLSGKVQIGKQHSSDNGWLKIGQDGIDNGLAIFDSANEGLDFRIFRSDDVAYFTRGRDYTSGLRIDNTGRVAIGINRNFSYTRFEGQFHVATENGSAISTRTYHTFDYGDAQKSMVYRPLSNGYAVHYNGPGTIYEITFCVRGNGDIYSGGSWITSDISTKKNVETISDPLSKVLQLRGVTFESIYAHKEPLKLDENELKRNDLLKSTATQINKELSRKRIGVVAQEVEQIVPEAVRTNQNGKKAVSYVELVGLLIEAMKEQQGIINEQNIRIAALENTKQIELRSTNENAGATSVNNIMAQCILSQNTPNPFTHETEIRYYVASGATTAMITIFDMQGKLLESYPAHTGQNSIVIEGSKLQPGMYLYSLIVDGQIVDTKKMLLTK